MPSREQMLGIGRDRDAKREAKEQALFERQELRRDRKLLRLQKRQEIWEARFEIEVKRWIARFEFLHTMFAGWHNNPPFIGMLCFAGIMALLIGSIYSINWIIRVVAAPVVDQHHTPGSVYYVDRTTVSTAGGEVVAVYRRERGPNDMVAQPTSPEKAYAELERLREAHPDENFYLREMATSTKCWRVRMRTSEGTEDVSPCFGSFDQAWAWKGTLDEGGTPEIEPANPVPSSEAIDPDPVALESTPP